jgi:hypothetical protein
MITPNPTEIRDAAQRLLDFGVLYAQTWAEGADFVELEALLDATKDAYNDLHGLVPDTQTGLDYLGHALRATAYSMP